jgi:hypothetical protein
MSGRVRRGQEVADLDRPVLRVDLAIDLANQRDRHASRVRRALVQHDRGSVFSASRHDTRDFPVVRVAALSQLTARVDDDDGSRIGDALARDDVEIFGAIGAGQQDVAGDRDVSLKKPRELSSCGPDPSA